MKKVLLIFCFALFLQADVYYARVQPLESYQIKASVSGLVVLANLAMEGKYVQNSLIVKIDDKINKKDLEISKTKLKNLKEIERISASNAKNAKKSYEIKKRNYDRIKNLKTKSNYEKDNQLILVINAKTQYLSAKQNLENLKMQIGDLLYKIFTLKDTISKKNISLKHRFLYKLLVKKGDFVSPGTLLMSVDDISKAKLTIYLSYSDMVNLDKKSIYINGKKSNIKFSKIWKVADSTNISSYEAELIIPAPKYFSKVVKIEIK